MSHDVKSSGAVSSLRPRRARQRGYGRSGAHRRQAQEDGKLLPREWSQISLFPALTFSYSRVMGWGWGGPGFIIKTFPELGGGRRAGARPRSVGRAGLLELVVPSPIFKAASPQSSLGAHGTCRVEGGGLGGSLRFLDSGPLSLPHAEWPGIRDNPHPSSAAWPQCGMRCGCRSRTPSRVTGLALGISLSLLTPGNPQRRLRSRAGQAWTLGCHGNWF